VITGNFAIAGQHVAGVPVLDRAVNRAMTAAEIAADLTQRLLAFARRQPLMPHLLDVNRLVQDMRDLLRRSLGADIEIEIVACPDLWQTNVDRSQLENSIINLAVNARDAMPEGGTLTIETANVYLDSDYARRNTGVTKRADEVSDTGTGMEADVGDRAAELSSRRRSMKAAALGLGMIYGFARQGRRLARRSSARRITAPACRVPAAGLGEKRWRPHREAAERLSGRQLAEEVARLRPGIRILFTSGYPSWAGKLVMEFGPGGPLLQKPYKKKQLAEKVREVLDATAGDPPTDVAKPAGAERP
jgi:hypothetical protein